MNSSYKKVDGETTVFPGDYIMYYDDDGNVVGSGALVKKQINTVFPLTKSYYVLKNLNTGKTWKVNCMKYDFYIQPHKTSSFTLLDFPELRELKQRLTETPTEVNSSKF